MQMKMGMLYIVVLLIFTTVASSYATDCSPPIKNVTCVCSNISLSCHGIQEDYLDIVELVTNISDSYPLEKKFSVDITIENIVLNPNSSFTNVTVSSLKLSSALSDLPDSLLSGVVDCLHVLNLKSNNFDRVPSRALMTLKQLHTLDLSRNNISTLSKNDFEGLDNLRTLNLEHNIISVIEPEVFSNLPLLQVLHLDHNVLVFLNSLAFKGLLNLNQLSISANVFDSLKSESFTMLSSLKILRADRNSLMDLENIHLDSVKLKELSVRQCAIHGPLKTDSLKSLPGLTSADFSYNNITEVQSFALAASFQLKHLNLSYNSIRTLGKDAFSSLFNLITLDMRYNEILVVPESAFYNLTRLKYLNLNSNDLRAFLCPYTVDLVSLESIHLENNKIKVIRSGAFIYSQNLTELKLSGNELNCSCYMHDFSTYLINRTSYWKEDISVIKCSSPQSANGESVINVDYSSMKCRSELPCESRIFGDVYEDDDEEEEEESTVIALSINDTSFTASENFSTVSSLNGHSTMSDNETSFSVPLTSSTDHVDIVTENITSIPPNTTAVQSNDSIALESTVSPFSSTSMYDDPIDIKNFSLVGKKLCIEWSVNQRILGNYSRCLLSYPPGHMQPVLRKYIKCPSPSSGTSDECVKIKTSVISELCIQLINSSHKAFAKHCVSDNETLLSVPLTSSTDNNTVVSTASYISLGSSAVATSHSTTSTTLGVTNVTNTFFSQEEISSTSSGTDVSSGSVSNFTILDPISSVTSLTQTSTPELTTKITNAVSEQVTSKSTEFSSSISGPSSATKAPYVSAGNETSTSNEIDFISTATSYSTTSTTLGVTNVTDTFFRQEETSSTSSGTNFSSGSVSNFTILDPIFSVTSLLTQTSTPELTTKITNSISKQVTSESTEFSSSIGGPSSATKPPYVSAGSETSTLNETDFISTATFSSDPLSTPSAKSDSSGSTSAKAIVSVNSMFTSDPENFSSLLPNTTVVLSNGSTASELTVSPLSSTTVYNYPIDVKQFSVIDKKLCIEWSINQRILSNVRHCLLSYTLRNMKPAHYIRCPLSNGTSEQCLKVKAAVISELCVQLINSSNQVFAVYCTHEHYIDHPPTSSSGSVSDEQLPFNITHLSVLGVGDSVRVEWTVNREEPSAICSLILNIESNNSVTEERALECKNNSYMVNSTKDNVVYEICLTSDHSAHDSVVMCKDYHVTKAIATEAAAVKSAQYYSYAILIGLLVLVICFIALLVVRAIFQKRSASDAYNVFRAEKSVSVRKRSEHQAVNQGRTFRYSYSASEAI